MYFENQLIYFLYNNEKINWNFQMLLHNDP